MSKPLRITLIFAGVVALLALVAFGPQIVSRLTKKSVGPALATVSHRSFPVVATATGTVQPQEQVNVNFAQAGTIKEIDVQVGQSVHSGQVLARLDDSSQSAEVQAAQVAVSSAEADLAAAQAAAAASPTPRPGSISVPNAQLEVAQAKLQLQRAQADEDRTILKASQDGTVLQVNNQVGDNVSAGGTQSAGVQNNGGTSSRQPFMVLGSGTDFEVFAAFSQNDATKLQPQQTGTASFDAIPGLSVPVHVAIVSTAATQVNGVPEFYAQIALDQSDPRLRNGMTATVSITIAQATNVLAVPNQAIFTLDNTPHVDVWFQGNAVPTGVSTGLTGDQLTQVTSGLSDGDQVVLPGPNGLPTPSPGSSPAASSS
jgi:membrane fusion protein, macrolide-specific efflux system